MGRKQRPLTVTNDVEQLAARLRDLRASRGMTVRELAARTGYAPSTVSKAEAGQRPATWEVVEAIVQACGHDPGRWRTAWERAAHTPALESQIPSQNERREVGDENALTSNAESTPPEKPRKARRAMTIAAVAITAVAVAVGITLLVIPDRHGQDNQQALPRSGESGVPTKDGLDPYVSGCGADQHELERRTVFWPDGTPYGELVYFHSTGCQASWGYVYGPNSSHWEVHIDAVRNPDSAAAPAYFSGEGKPNSWGNMLSTTPGCVLINAYIRTSAGQQGPITTTSCFSAGGPVSTRPR